MKNQKDLIVRYQGKKKEINLVIKDCPDDVEIRTQLQDPDFEAEWKSAYLDSHYEERLNNQREAGTRRHSSLESFTYEDEKYFSSKDDPHEILEKEEEMHSLISLCTTNQQEILILHFIEGYSKTEIAEMRDVDESAIRKTINRAIATIKRNL